MHYYVSQQQTHSHVPFLVCTCVAFPSGFGLQEIALFSLIIGVADLCAEATVSLLLHRFSPSRVVGPLHVAAAVAYLILSPLSRLGMEGGLCGFFLCVLCFEMAIVCTIATSSLIQVESGGPAATTVKLSPRDDDDNDSTAVVPRELPAQQLQGLEKQVHSDDQSSVMEGAQYTFQGIGRAIGTVLGPVLWKAFGLWGAGVFGIAAHITAAMLQFRAAHHLAQEQQEHKRREATGPGSDVSEGSSSQL